ncbi:hypothetical protein F5Y17DRAFT_476367 [Xylariaceae sp. FL0594]|nr:hypothetical protein F5Y17DRAFT_476367 [Xylariaceae sp. FL0594]
MSTAEAIQAVEKISGALVARPGSTEYEELRASYYTELERELKPACFFTPSSARDVADIISAIKPFTEALASKIAICGAGQQCTPGVTNVQDGLTMHLRGLRGIEIHADREVVSVGAGERMGDVYEKVMAEGLGVVGNRHSTGGIGGDAVHGGLSYFSYARGFVCDNVINYEIVLADGQIVNANATTTSGLFRALKGGSNNFGIVTRYDLRTFRQGQLWGGKILYPEEPSFAGQIQHLVKYLNDPNPDRNVHICLSIGYIPTGQMMAMNDIFCTRPEKPDALKPFADIEEQMSKPLRVGNLEEFTDESYAGAVKNRVTKMTTIVKADVEVLQYALHTFKERYTKLKDAKVENLLWSLSFEPIPVSLIKQSDLHGGNSLGLTPSDGPLVVVLLYTSWANARSDALINEVNRSVLADIEAHAREKGAYSPYLYMNYAYPGRQDAIASYGLESKARLRDVSESYDPDGFFQKAGVGPWKIRL